MAGSPCNSRKMSGHQRSAAQAGLAGLAACSCVFGSQHGGLAKTCWMGCGEMLPCAACKPLPGASQMGTASCLEDLWTRFLPSVAVDDLCDAKCLGCSASAPVRFKATFDNINSCFLSACESFKLA